MKKFLIGLFASAVWALAATAQATVINFDGLDANGKLASIGKYNPYGGLTWTGTWHLGVNSVTGYSNAAHSGTQFLLNGFGVNNLGVSSTEVFDFVGAWFATPATNGSKASWINISAYNLANQLIGSTGNVTIDGNFSWVAANFSDVARLNITRDKGWFVMDDFTMRDPSVVPEPGTPALLLLALAALGLTRRGKMR